MNRRTALGGGLAAIALLLSVGCGIPLPWPLGTLARATGATVALRSLTSYVTNPIRRPTAETAAKSPTRVPLGVTAPTFELSDALGETFRTEDFRSAPVLVVVFLSNRCPLARHITNGLADFASEYQERGVITVAINSNDPERYPEDSIENIARAVAAGGYTFPYLIDVKQEVAKAFLAEWTPDFYVFDRQRRLVYQGQFDDSRPGNRIAVTGGDLRTAVDAVLANSKQPSLPPKQAVGCAIAWKEGADEQPAGSS